MIDHAKQKLPHKPKSIIKSIISSIRNYRYYRNKGYCCIAAFNHTLDKGK